jgi:EmrB/QacA subfamily drug resistance transporter
MEMMHMDGDAAKRGMILFVVLLSSFVTPFMSSSVNIALPAIANEFGLNAVMLNWVATSFLLATAVFLLPVGRFADIYGRAKIFAAGMAVFSVATLVAGISNSIAVLIIARVVQGMGSAFIFSTGVAMLSMAYRPDVRGKVIGYSIAMVYIGLTAGPFLGGWLTQHYSWRMIFLATVPFSVAAFFLTIRIASSEEVCIQKCAMDYTGSLAYALGLFLAIYGFSRLPDNGYFPVFAGVCLLAVFILWERKSLNPLIDLRLLTRNRIFLFSNIAALINYSATFATGFILSLYLQYIKGLSPEKAGLILVASPVVMAAIAPISGRLSDKINARILSSLGMAVTAIGLSFFIFLTDKSDTLYVIGSLLILGAGLGVFSSPNTNAIMGSVETSAYGVASGMLATMRLTGQTVSMAVVMMIFAIVIGRVEITPLYYPGFMHAVHLCFILNSVLCVAGVLVSLAGDKKTVHEQSR